MPEWLIVSIGYMLAVATIVHIVMERREPTATLAWVLGVALLPYLGVLLYLLIGRRRLNRQVKRRRVRAIALEPQLAGTLSKRLAAAEKKETALVKRAHRPLVRLSNRMGSRPPTAGNRVELLVDADAKYKALEEAILSAKDHIHLLYYIFQQDQTGQRFRDLLIRRAKEGIKVRVLTDGVGSLGLDSFMIPLVAVGGQHAEFLPVNIFRRRWALNLRNHRKIAVIDGKVGFTGGVNIGDEYTGRKKKVGMWRDTHLLVEGPAVDHLQEIFAEDWHFATGQDPLPDESWFPEKQPAGESTVQVVASGPDTDTQPIQRIFFSAVTSAKKSIYLTTPYFVPDQAMRVALETAALRGVDVRLLLPARSDMTLVLHAGRSYYDDLLESGVKIYEYQAGILHAKTLVVDSAWSTVGSANMDIRSFKLNFEVNASIYGDQCARQLGEVFMADLEQAKQINTEDLRRKPKLSRVAESLARTLSPVL